MLGARSVAVWGLLAMAACAGVWAAAPPVPVSGQARFQSHNAQAAATTNQEGIFSMVRGTHAQIRWGRSEAWGV